MTSSDGTERIVEAESTKKEDEDAGGKSRGCSWPQLCYCSHDMLAIKVFHFGFMAVFRIVETYSPVFLKQHGLSAFEIGIVSGIRPVIGFLSAPLWGALADRYNIRRVVMLFSLVTWLAFYMVLYTIPEPGRRDKCPELLQTFVHHERFHSLLYLGSIDDNDAASPQHPTVSSSLTTAMTADLDHNAVPSNAVDEWMLRTNESLPDGLNSSLISVEVQELLREDLKWLYEPTSRYHVFIVCLLIICGGEFFQSPTSAMADAATFQILGRERLHEYGAHRAWGGLGWAISTSLTGFLLDFVSWNEVDCGVSLTLTDYRIVSLVFIVPFVISFVAATKINFSIDNSQTPMNEKTNLKSTNCSSNSHSEAPKAQHEHNAFAVIKFFINVRNGSWLATATFFGVFKGIAPAYVFWHLENIGGTKILMGVDGIIVSLLAFTLYFFASHFVKLIGHVGVMYLCLFLALIRFFVYASITNPWIVLSVSPLEGFMHAVLWVSMAQYTATAVPSASLASIMGILHGVYYGLGDGVGHFLGGVFINQFGAVATFYGVAVAIIIWLAVFFVCQQFSEEPANPFAYQDMGVENDAKSVASSNRDR